MPSTKPQVLPVAVDAMGGDEAPATVVAGACLAVRAGVPILLVGDSAQIEPLLAQEDLPADAQIGVLHTDQVVGMGDAPLAGLRDNPDSSVRLALEAVAERRASAAVSFGNSGAAVVESVRTLRLLDGVDRPALAVALPTRTGAEVILLDVGANVDVRPEQLAAFASLGLAWSRSRGVSEPRVAVLSNGHESSKGNALVRACLAVLAERGINAVPLEPGAVLAGACDVVVCDGFVGNILIKGFEAAVELVSESSPSGPDPAQRGGALLLGVDGVVVVGHGASTARAVFDTIVRTASIGGVAWVANLAHNLDKARTRA